MAQFRLPRPHPDAVRFVPFFVGVNLIGGVHLPFFPAWLASVGFTPESIGLLLMAMGLARLFTGPALGFLADALAARRLAIVVLIGIAASSYTGYLLPGAAFIVLFSITSSVAFSAIRPLIDGLMLKSALQHQFDYGRVVSFGSAAFIVANFTSGFLLEQQGIGFFLVILITAGAFAFAGSFVLPTEASAGEPPKVRSMLRDARALVRQPVFLLIVATASIAQSTHGFYYGFATLNWKALGYSTDVIGILWALGVVAEIVLFSMSNRAVARVGPVGLFAIAGVSGLVRWTLLALSPPMWLLIPVQCLHAGTFGAAHLGAMHTIARAVPPHLIGTAQSLYSSITVGGFLAAAQFASGFLFADYGAYGYLLMTAMSAVALGLSLLLGRLWNGGQLSLEPARA